jgi:uncharacterized metal-binding protein YceD (DUF177 family)
MTTPPPYTRPFDLSSLSEVGCEETFKVPVPACDAIAEFYELDGLEGFTVRIRLTRLSKNEFRLEGHFAVTVIQTCIVTLKPVHSIVEEDFERVFIVAPLRAAQRAAGAVDVTLEEDEAEMLRGSSVDLAAPVLEELSLMIDPYPRTPGAAFEGGMAAPSAEESPFAVLQALKDKLEPPEKT